MATDDPGGRRLDAAAAVALAGVASAHGQAVAHKLEEAPYVAALFAGLIVAATGLAAVLASGRATARAWGLAGGLALGALAAYVVSRTLGLPQLADHVGHWLDPAALAALACEAVVVALWIARSRRARAAARRASALALPEPAVAWRAVAAGGAAALVLVAGGGAVQDALAGGRVGAHAAGAGAHVHGAGHGHGAGHAHGAGRGHGAGHAHGSGHGHGAAAETPADAHVQAEEGGGAGQVHAGGEEAGARHAHGAGRAHAHAHVSGGAAARGAAARGARRGHRHAGAAGVQEPGGGAHHHAPAGGAAAGTAAQGGGRSAERGAHRHGPTAGHGGAHAELLVTATGAIAMGRPAPLRLGAATAAQRTAARSLLDRSIEAAARLFPDVAAARRRGYVMPRSAARARLVHLNHAGRTADDHLLDPERPESLVFLRRPGRPLRLVAFMFRTRTGRPPTPSPLLRWHVHGWCTDAGVRHGSGVTVPDARCGAGRLLHHGATMMFHLWLADDLPAALALDAPAAVLSGPAARPRAPSPPPAARRPSAPRPDRVVRVLGGDLVELERLGEARLAGVLAPSGAEPCAQAAHDAVARLLEPGAAVSAVWEAPRQDGDGRVLVSLRREGADVAAQLVRDGLAAPASAPVARHLARLEPLAARARAAGRGMWAAAPACA